MSELRFNVGDRVQLTSSGERGVVIHTWHNDELDVQDCYVAFFGEQIPSGEPAEKPYILRYSSVSLSPHDE